MRVVYVDTGLMGEVGHHATSCRLIAEGFRARGHAVTVAAWQGMQPALRVELGARAVFRQNTYGSSDDDPMCGWLVSHFTTAQVTAEDFATLFAEIGPLGPDDLLYVNSVLPAQLAATNTYLASLPDAARPQTMVELGTDPGVEFVSGADGSVSLAARDPRYDARATLYRLVARQMAARRLPELTLFTFDRTSSDTYAMLLGTAVTTLPLPHRALAPVRARGGEGPRTVAFLGHQRGEKGFHLVPGIAALLARADVRVLIHNGHPGGMPTVQDALRSMAAADPRITLDERPAGPDLWAALLERADLIVCPYAPDRFRAAYSALASEAIAAGIPFVAPEHTTLARLMRDFSAGGDVFSGHDPQAVADAVSRVLAEFDTHAARSAEAAALWPTRMGAERTIDALLARAGAAAMDRRAPFRLAA